jgi:hypothetical protein
MTGLPVLGVSVWAVMYSFDHYSSRCLADLSIYKVAEVRSRAKVPEWGIEPGDRVGCERQYPQVP